jgi:hypothetical protein
MSKNQPPDPWIDTAAPEKSDDKKHCIALHHEFLSCEDAYNDFIALQKQSITNESRRAAYMKYNAYSRFILHLYEFLIGATKREIGLQILKEAAGSKSIFSFRRNIPHKDADLIIQGRTELLFKIYRDDVISGRLTKSLLGYPETVPEQFASEFRNCRNHIIGHVSLKRAKLDLTQFYADYHKLLLLHFENAQAHWGIENLKAFPDLEEITRFNLSTLDNKEKPY